MEQQDNKPTNNINNNEYYDETNKPKYDEIVDYENKLRE